MCGIIGFTGRDMAVPKLLEGLSALEYRGYDSAGIAYFADGALKVTKAGGRLSVLEEKLSCAAIKNATSGI